MKLTAALMPAAALSLAACGQSDSDRLNQVAAEVHAEKQAELNAPAPQSTTTPSGLRFETLTPGNGPRPQLGQPVMVTYEGRLTDGTMFDSSAQPVPMVVGQLIPGFNEGLLLMNKGGRYRLRIPPELGYGAAGAGGVIPPNAELDFLVTLVDIGDGATPAQLLPPEGNSTN
ncbi:FKBP-type peptidyl-prolyl cis-trans isomerase [Sphingosinicella sp. LHD-64]|uniref:FKBP-type peptidyl-prolyl cis-trans isomerase n=1 Tax=Sphingosinicella sp. LHD-64 TaxID=3072139 RepID=UPI00280EA2DC|nr:FKBP-type peptidyl-prolyl cis-trans isomerase [Sphingosinicella sp. LHD-64]MDQ8757055.1 FKBP-type peptidyl-prolyl cis-trans isomerase [Sphingosinicella sp. LHD-64]